MLNFSPLLEWAVAITALLAVGGLIYRVIGLVPMGGLLRCPDTGAMTFVDVGRASRGDGSEPKLTVQACDLWPKQYECKGRCLASQKWAVWRKWEKFGPAPISEAEARHRMSSVSSETWV